MKTIDSKRTLDAVLEAPKRFKREWQKTGATGAITKFPIPTVLVFLLLTAYFVSQSGFLDNTRFDDDLNNPALNVNGDLEVYLPDGSQVAELIGKVEEDWSTNVMVVYIESTKGNNITNQRILQEISYVERLLNPQLSDDSDDVIYILSLSTVLKEVNSSAPRIREAVVTEVGELGCSNDPDDNCPSREFAKELNEAFALTDEQFGGSYEIPSQTTIDLVIGEMYTDEGQPSAGMNKLARDIEGGEDGGPDGVLDRAIMAIAVTEDRPAKEIIADTQEILDAISKLERACEFEDNGEPDESEGMCTWEDLGSVHGSDRSGSDYQRRHRIFIQVVLGHLPQRRGVGCYWVVHLPLRPASGWHHRYASASRLQGGRDCRSSDVVRRVLDLGSDRRHEL